MFIYCYLPNLIEKRLEKAKVYNSYAELLAEITPDHTWNGYYYDVEIHSEQDLDNILKLQVPPPGMEDYRNSEDHNNLYFLNRIYDHQREAIPAGWKNIRWVVGLHREHHVNARIARDWYEKCWSVIGVIAIDWPEKPAPEKA